MMSSLFHRVIISTTTPPGSRRVLSAVWKLFQVDSRMTSDDASS
jgi:hypothetical protein